LYTAISANKEDYMKYKCSLSRQIIVNSVQCVIVFPQNDSRQQCMYRQETNYCPHDSGDLDLKFEKYEKLYIFYFILWSLLLNNKAISHAYDVSIFWHCATFRRLLNAGIAYRYALSHVIRLHQLVLLTLYVWLTAFLFRSQGYNKKQFVICDIINKKYKMLLDMTANTLGIICVWSPHKNPQLCGPPDRMRPHASKQAQPAHGFTFPWMWTFTPAWWLFHHFASILWYFTWKLNVSNQLMRCECRLNHPCREGTYVLIICLLSIHG